MLSSIAPSALSHGDGAPGAGAEDSSPAHADFGGMSSGAAPVVVLLDVVPLPPRYSAPTVAGCRVDILLDVIGGVESALREGCPRTMTGVGA